VGDADRFCAKCGAVQHASGAPRASSASDPISNISSRNASLLCYIPYVGWIAAIVVLASERFRSDAHVRFHAFQGLYLFVAWLMNDQVLKWALMPVAHFHLHDLVSAVLLVMSILMMVKASHDEMYSLPLFGDLAHRSMSEN
jgi:uncharacterized membrane protein